jgi:hypothetical protein
MLFSATFFVQERLCASALGRIGKCILMASLFSACYNTNPRIHELLALLPPNAPLIDRTGCAAHLLAKRALLDSVRFVEARDAGILKIAVDKKPKVVARQLEPIQAIVHNSHWGELHPIKIGPDRWVVFYDAAGNALGCLHGSDRRYELYLGVQPSETGSLDVSNAVSSLIRLKDGRILARPHKDPRASPRICEQGIIFEVDPFETPSLE